MNRLHVMTKVIISMLIVADFHTNLEVLLVRGCKVPGFEL